MRYLLNHCLIIFRREQKPEPKPVPLTPDEYRAAVAQVAKQLRAIL